MEGFNLEKNQKANLNPEGKDQKENLERIREIDNYLQNIEATEQEYAGKLVQFAQNIGELPSNIDVSLVIPAYKEEGKIQRMLVELKAKSGQNVEVILVVNRPKGTVSDQTHKIASEYKSETQWENLKILEVEFPQKIAGVGSARKLSSDLALLRYRKALEGGREQELIIAGSDADIEKVPLGHYDEIVQLIREGRIEVVAGSPGPYFPEEWLDDFYATHPNFKRLKEINKTLYSEKQKGEEFNVVGQDFALTASAYAKIGGIPRLKQGEDTAISDKATELKLRTLTLNQDHSIRTSPRRQIVDWQEFLFGQPYIPERFVRVSEQIKLTDEELRERLMDIPDLTDEQIIETIKNQIVSRVLLHSRKKDEYLDIALEEVLSNLRSTLSEKELWKKISNNLLNLVRKESLKMLVGRQEEIEKRLQKAQEEIIELKSETNALNSLISKLSLEDRILSEKKTKLGARLGEIKLRIQILSILRTTTESDFTERYSKNLEQLEGERFELEKQFRSPRTPQDKK